MNRLLFLLAIAVTMQQSVLAQCGVGSYSVTTNATISSSCIINGDVTIANGATLNVDFTAASADTFVVRGNILLQGNAVLWVHGDSGSTGDQFIVSNMYNQQRTITTNDSSRIQLEYIEFRTQEGNLAGASSWTMNLNAQNKSVVYVNKCWLNTQTAWLLCNMRNQSTLMSYGNNDLPTESYLNDSAQIAIHGSAGGIWMMFGSGTYTLNLPPNQTSPYNWKIGRGNGGLATPWYLEIDTANPGIGVQIFPSSNVTISGAGFPATGELKVALNFSNNTDSVTNLAVGLQNKTVADGPAGGVTLHNVNLGPIAWQLYALIHENLYIKNSIVNEIGVGGPSNVVVDSSLLQLGELAAVSAGGCTMNINNTEIWNQAIIAANSSHMTLNNCRVTGSDFSTTDALSTVIVNGGCFYANPTGCSQATMVNITTGQPNCNPFIPPGFPQNLTPATVTFNGVDSNCAAGNNEIRKTNEIAIFPNPANENLNIILPENREQRIQIYNAMGMIIKEFSSTKSTQINIADLPNGLYFVHFKNESQPTSQFIKE